MNNLWQFLILLVLASVVSARFTHKAHNKFEEGLLKVIEKWRTGDVGSLPIALPSLKSFKLGSMKINYDGYTAGLNGITVNGLENVSIEKLSASESDFTVSLAFIVPKLKVLADKYHLQGTALFGLYTIDDRGQFQADVHNLRASAVVKFGASGSNTVIKRLNINFSVGGVRAYLSGSSSIVNNGFNNKLSNMLRNGKSQVISKAKHIIEKMVKKILKGYTPEKLVEIISKV